MKAISIRQPWAWAILYAGKDIENRVWTTPYRGPLLIHASSHKPTHHERSISLRTFAHAQPGRPLSDMPETFTMGSIVGVCDLVDCVSESRSPWWMGPKGLVLANPRRLQPFGWKGGLGLFEVPDATPELVRALANVEVL
jgi:hypothetical protein